MTTETQALLDGLASVALRPDAWRTWVDAGCPGAAVEAAACTRFVTHWLPAVDPARGDGLPGWGMIAVGDDEENEGAPAHLAVSQRDSRRFT